MSENKSTEEQQQVQQKESKQKPRPPLYSVLLCSKECASGSWIHWDYLRNDEEDYVGDFVVLYDLISVTIHEEALVQVNLSIHHNNTQAPVAFELEKVTQKSHVRTIQMFSAYTSDPERYITTNASVLLKMKQHEQIRVKYVGTGVASRKSRLSLVGMQMHFD
jgi:hypothetical protein